ncbi:PLP-dependent aminotransferase family protein, partial [Anaerovibrio sp.]|uniref:MocR-like pyridoxine biosynthesis transcription factor PdxR n=1 Tax=Anaerovibrio sp. TaxID=1872532 RepID=UPI003F13C6CE
LAVSRNTVIGAYSQLIAEGYLQSLHGSGTMVAEGLCNEEIAEEISRHASGRQKNAAVYSRGQAEAKNTAAVYSRGQAETKNTAAVCSRGQAEAKNTAASVADMQAEKIIDFCTGIPALEYFPGREWGRLYREVCDTIPAAAYGYGETFGVGELRESIAEYMYRLRGIDCPAERIMITTGATQGLSLISGALGSDGKKVLLEEPTHKGLREVIRMTGCQVEGITVDGHGMCTGRLPDGWEIAFIYVTPSHQYPLGSVMSIARRLELIRYAERHDCYIVEDDYDGEFRYEGQPVSSLYELKPERVIYLGSFSKILAPALRLGFMMLPQQLMDRCAKIKMYSDVNTDVLGQYVLNLFIRRGGFARHIWKMKKLYSRKRKLLLRELSASFPDGFSVLGHATGLHVVIKFHAITFDSNTEMALRQRGVGIHRLEQFYLDGNGSGRHEIIMGYAHLSDEDIIRGVQALRDYFSA